MSTPAIPPPAYNSPNSPPKTNKTQYGSTESIQAFQDNDQAPLLNNHHQHQQQPQFASGSNAPRNDWGGEGSEDDDIPEDFKIGMTVSQSSQDVRNSFIRKVYGVLFCQIVSLSCLLLTRFI